MNDSNFCCKPARGERVETRLQIETDTAAVICGVVSDLAGVPISGALVLLFRVEARADGDGAPPLLAQGVTDSDGHFAFGGLEGDVLYRVKVFPQGGTVRVLELGCQP